MPGYLFHFCAEWQKARKILQLDYGTLCELVSCIVDDNGDLCPDSIVVQEKGLAGWRLDVASATEAGFLSPMDNQAETGNFGLGPNLIMRSTTSGNLSPRAQISVGFNNRSTTTLLSGNLTGTISQGPIRSVTEKMYASKANVEPPIMREPVLFRNPSHPLTGMPAELTREEFAQEVRKRLFADRLFSTSSHHQDNIKEPILSLEDAEDLFEALLIMQSPSGMSSILQTGRQLDAVCDRFFALTRLRQIMEKGANTLSAFFNALDLGKRKGLEATDFRLFVKNAGGEFLNNMANALAAEGVDVNRLTETLFSALDANKDEKVELWEMRKQISLSAPPRMSMVEIVGHFEMKNGYGKSAIPNSIDRQQLFDHLCRKESLDFSPEDVARCFRAVAGGANARLVHAHDFDHFLKSMPLEVSWGVEPHVADRLFCAMGARTLQIERTRQMDACLPVDALLTSVDQDEMLDKAADEADIRQRFDRLWDRCVGNSGSFSGSAGRQLRDGCFRRFRETVEMIREKYQQLPQKPDRPNSPKSRGATRAMIRRFSLPRPLFPNVSDVLAVASTQLHMGQACIVRYRLTGNSNFWGPSHTVFQNDRDPIPWPCPRRLLGETPFIGLCPRGRGWNAGGGGDHHLVSQVRCDLPRDPTSGQVSLFGIVEIVPPSLLRTTRTREDGLSQDFELRLFCSTKQKITGSIGEALMVQVVHQVRPPPLATLQVRCVGRSASLRWSILDLGPQARRTGVDAVRLHMKSTHTERTMTLDGDVSEWEVQDLAPDTEYEFRVRLENRAGPGREAVATCRTNACCSAPAGLSCAVSSTAHVELRWSPPKALGNGATTDRFQQNRESIDSYQASLRVGHEDRDSQKEPNSRRASAKDDLGDDLIDASTASASTSRKCQFLPNSWRESQDGSLTARLNGLRPDTRYVLEAFSGINSMGRGACCKPLIFWTVPQTPRIANVRVKRGLVKVALALTGGVNVKDYMVVIALTERPSEKASFDLPQSNLQDEGVGQHPELTLPFDNLPPVDTIKTHNVQVRASNSGGWSDWSAIFEACAIAKQQGAEKAMAALIRAMKERRIEALTRLLAEIREIEVSDTKHVEEATELLKKLVLAKSELQKAMQIRDPHPLAEALAFARKVQLPDLSKSEALLRKLEGVVLKLDTAKGIDALRAALKAAHEARLPPRLLTAAVERLGTREAAQQALEQAMEAARVPGLRAALEHAEGMHLPSEDIAKKLLAALQDSETLLTNSLESRLILDLTGALESAATSGLKEEALIESACTLRDELLAIREEARAHLMGAMNARHPADLHDMLDTARRAQVLQEDMLAAEGLLRHIEGLIEASENAVGEQQRREALKAAYAAEVPASLLQRHEDQLENLMTLHKALERGSAEEMRIAIKHCESVGVKEVEMAEAKVVYVEWFNADHELEVSLSLAVADRLRRAIQNCLDVGIAQDQLDAACSTLQYLERRDSAAGRLRGAIEARQCEKLQEAWKAACDADVRPEMLQYAQWLVGHLQKLRLQLAAAVETNDLKRVYDAFGLASTPPALPERELSPVRRQLSNLQKAESDDIADAFSEAKAERKTRTLDYLARRAEHAMLCGVKVVSGTIEEAERIAEEEIEQQRSSLEDDVLIARMRRECAQWRDNPPDKHEEIEIPTGVVTGTLTLYLNSAGSPMGALPREIVEGKLVVPCPEIENVILDSTETDLLIQSLLGALRRLLEDEDDLHRLCDRPFDSKSWKRKLTPRIVEGNFEIPFSVQVRGNHTGVEIAEALVERSQLGADLWQSNGSLFLLDAPKGANPKGERPGRPLVRRRPSQEIVSLAGKLSRQLTEKTADGPKREYGPTRSRRICDFVTNVRTRILKQVTVELGWCYPRGLMDALDATCLVFDEDQLVEIVDHRGCHGFRYGAGPGSGKGQSGSDATAGAVRYSGDVMDDEDRTGKQVMYVRLDLMPKRITDLVFVLSAYNSRDLSKFADLKANIVDIDGTTEILAGAQTSIAGGVEAFLMCSLYRLTDGLWRANSFMTPCKGTARDYKPVLNRLLELGYPRNVSMRDQVPRLFRGMQREFLPDNQSVKSSGISINEENTMTVPYVIELFSNSTNGPQFVETLDSETFHRNVLMHALNCESGGERFSEDHLVVCPPSTKDYTDLRLELQWNYPKPKSSEQTADSSPKQEENYLDVACILFEGQALREVLDYRGAHGVRIVHNGVLDYGGVWVGKTAIGDASGGAIWHGDLEMANDRRVGKQIMDLRLDLLPRHATDLFFCLSAPANLDVCRYHDVHARILDRANPGHEVGKVRWNRQKSDPAETMEAVVLCCLSRSQQDAWQLVSYGCLTHGHAGDYRPMILCLRAIQANRYSRPPPWPYQKPLNQQIVYEREKKDRQALMLPKLPQAMVLDREDTFEESDSGFGSEMDLMSSDGGSGVKASDTPVSQNFKIPAQSRSSLSNIAGKGMAMIKKLSRNSDTGRRDSRGSYGST